jgi:hypothetical protein
MRHGCSARCFAQQAKRSEMMRDKRAADHDAFRSRIGRLVSSTACTFWARPLALLDTQTG